MWNNIVVVHYSPAVVDKSIVLKCIVVVPNSRHSESVQNYILSRSNAIITDDRVNQNADR